MLVALPRCSHSPAPASRSTGTSPDRLSARRCQAPATARAGIWGVPSRRRSVLSGSGSGRAGPARRPCRDGRRRLVPGPGRRSQERPGSGLRCGWRSRSDRVAAIQDPQASEQIIGQGEPHELVGMATGEVGQHPCITWVRLRGTGIEVGGSAHLQAGHVRHRCLGAGGNGQHELPVGTGLVDDQRYPTVLRRGGMTASRRPRRWPRPGRTARRPGRLLGRSARTCPRRTRRTPRPLRSLDYSPCSSRRRTNPASCSTDTATVNHLTNQPSRACPHQRWAASRQRRRQTPPQAINRQGQSAIPTPPSYPASAVVPAVRRR
jgi:hypothetical protein